VALAAERTRANWLRDHVDDLNAKLTDTQNNLTAAQNDLAAAQEALTTARDLEAARKAGGRWARLRAAWRGE
jgi:hypothetical protein